MNIIERRKKVISNQLLVSKMRLEIAQALLFQNRLFIVDLAD